MTTMHCCFLGFLHSPTTPWGLEFPFHIYLLSKISRSLMMMIWKGRWFRNIFSSRWRDQDVYSTITFNLILIFSSCLPCSALHQTYKELIIEQRVSFWQWLCHPSTLISPCLSFPELHPVHPAVHLRPADVDGQPVHLRLRLLQRRDHCQVLQTVCPAEGAGAGGGQCTQSDICQLLNQRIGLSYGSARVEANEGEINRWSLWVINGCVGDLSHANTKP